MGVEPSRGSGVVGGKKTGDLRDDGGGLGQKFWEKILGLWVVIKVFVIKWCKI